MDAPISILSPTGSSFTSMDWIGMTPTLERAPPVSLALIAQIDLIDGIDLVEGIDPFGERGDAE